MIRITLWVGWTLTELSILSQMYFKQAHSKTEPGNPDQTTHFTDLNPTRIDPLLDQKTTEAKTIL